MADVTDTYDLVGVDSEDVKQFLDGLLDCLTLRIEVRGEAAPGNACLWNPNT